MSGKRRQDPVVALHVSQGQSMNLDGEGYRAQAEWPSLGGLLGGSKGGEVNVGREEGRVQ